MIQNYLFRGSLMLSPIVVFAYNRPEHLSKVLNALSENYLANQSDLYIYVDGPKTEEGKKYRMKF